MISRIAIALAFLAITVQAKTVNITNTTLVTRACQAPHIYPFCNTSLSIDARIEDLISRLKSEDKPRLMTAREAIASAVPEIGLPELDWGANCIHGAQTSCVNNNGETICPTSFPNPVNFGFTFNKTMFHELGAIIGKEMRALWLAGATEEHGKIPPHIGLDCWSPNININRDPRWGRNQETPSEDPLVNGFFGELYTKGNQNGEDDRYIQVITTLKHWDAYSLENSDGVARGAFNAIIANHTLQDTYFPAFKQSVVDGGAKGVMCSYNAINGVPTCASALLNHTLRTQWGFSGYITSDTGAVKDVWLAHHYTTTGEEAVCKTLVDGECDMDSGAMYIDYILTAVGNNTCSMANVDKGLTHLLRLRFELGLLDPIGDQPYWKGDLSQVGSPESRATSLLATLESMVLLKNDNGTLPISVGSKVAVIGPHANAQSALVGNYLGQLCPDDTTTCIQSVSAGIESANQGGQTSVVETPLTNSDTSSFAAAVAAAKQSDVVVLALGIDETIERESHDRVDIALPDIQKQLVLAVAAAKKPMVMVLINGGMVGLDNLTSSVSAILEAGYPGVEGAEAIGKTLFGTNDHLGGKLSYTVYPSSYVDEIHMSEMEMDVGPGRSYRYYQGTPTFPFGHGISLTSFAVHSLRLVDAAADTRVVASTTSLNEGSLLLDVDVVNVGQRPGDEVVLVFMKWRDGPTARASRNMTSPQSSFVEPIKKLVGFERVHLEPSQRNKVRLSVSRRSFCVVERASGHVVAAAGSGHLIVTNGVDTELILPFEIVGDNQVLEAFPDPNSAS